MQEKESQLALNKKNIQHIISIISGDPKLFKELGLNKENFIVSEKNWGELQEKAQLTIEKINHTNNESISVNTFTNGEPNFFLKSDLDNNLIDDELKTEISSFSIGNISPQKLDFQTLLYFLEQVAEKQRAQEKNFLKSRLLFLNEKNIFNSNDNDIKTLKNEMKKFEDEENYDGFYKILIKLLNILMLRDKELGKKRAEQLTKEKKEDPELVEILTAISKITSSILGGDNDNKLSKAEMKGVLLSNIVEKIKDKKFDNFSDYFSFLLYYLNEIRKGRELDDITSEKYPRLFNMSADRYLDKKDKLIDLLGQLQTKLELISGNNKAKQKKDIDKIKSFIRSLETTSDSSLLKITDSELTLYSIDERMSWLEDSIIEAFSFAESSGKGNLADDVRIGFYDYFLDQDVAPESLQLFSSLDDFIVKARSQGSKVFKESLTMSNVDFKDIIQKLEELKGGFILHETDKYYQRAFDRKFFEGHSFTGRTMNLFNYISSMNLILSSLEKELDENEEKTISFLALNSYNDAVASKSKEPLEKIFSIFSGLIMFDDFVLVAKQYLNEKEDIEDTQHIHLYRVQELYFPSSYFLYQTLQFLQKKEGQANNMIENEVISKIDWSSFNLSDQRKRKVNLFKKYIDIQQSSEQKHTYTFNIINKEEERNNTWIDFTSGWEGRNAAAKKAVKIKIKFFKDFYKFLEEIFDIK